MLSSNEINQEELIEIQRIKRRNLLEKYRNRFTEVVNDVSPLKDAIDEEMLETLRRRKEDMMARYVGNLEKMTELLPTTKANNVSEYEDILRNYAIILALKKRSLLYRSSL